MSEHEVGSLPWWQTQYLFSLRGPVDSILRLLEQQEITRAKARELIFYVARVIGGHWMQPAPEEGVPRAPWGKLDWCGDAVPDDAMPGDTVVWLDDYENDTVDPQDGEEPIDIWWDDMRPRETRRLAKEAYERGRRTGKAAARLARIRGLLVGLRAGLAGFESAASALLLVDRVLKEIDA